MPAGRAEKEQVAPFTGAWVEIQRLFEGWKPQSVAPFTGAWVEMLNGVCAIFILFVAPFTGAWVEIQVGRHHN